MRKITQTIVGTTPPLDKNVIWLDSTDNTAPVEKVFINGVWTPMGVDTDNYYTKEEVNDKLDEKLDVIETPVNGNLIAMDSQGQAIDSGKKTTDFIATPTDSGSEGEVLSVDSEGNPVWTTVTPTGTADTEMSDTSTNAVQNKVIKSYVDDNCARKDGYYSTLTAGAAENLVGQTVDSEAYLIRPTGGTENEVANGVASVLGMEGNSCVWNQLINDSWSALNNIGTVTINGNDVTCTKTSSPTSTSFLVGNGGIPNSKAASLIGHKVYIELYLDSMSEDFTSASLGFMNESYSMVGDFPFLTQERVGSIRTTVFTVPNTTYRFGVKFNANVPQNAWVKFSNVKVTDLTLLGIDNLHTSVEVSAWLAQHVGTKPYYAYNAGTILSAQTLGIKTYGQNLLNPTTRQAKLIPYTWVENDTTYSNQYTIKNVPSGATATFTPDKTGVAVTVDISGGTLDITSYGSGVLELSAATANTYVCIRWNGTKDNDVVPYEDHTYDFDVTKVYGKVNGEGEYAQCFPYGMRGAGAVHDELTAEKAIRKMVLQNLGSKSWTSHIIPVGSGIKRWEFSLSVLAKTSSYVTNQVNTRGYINSIVPISTNSKNNNFAVGSSGTLFLRDDNGDDMTNTQFKAYMNGVYLLYEMDTPITYTDLIYRDGGVDRPLADVLMNITVNNWSMEEQLLTPYENGNPTSIPATIKTQYGMDAVEAIGTLQKTCYFANDVRANLQALLTCVNTNCAETLGGTFSVSDTATDKVFGFTFTPNTEPEP